MINGGTTPPGWYPDPYYPGSTRYWDGATWTAHAQRAGYPAGPSIPVLDVEGGHIAADRAVKAFMAQCLVQVFGALLYAALVAALVDQIRRNNDLAPGATPTFDGKFILIELALTPVGLIGAVATVFIVIWCYKATTNARAMGQATTHSPGWAVGGWFVPILSLFYPYQVIRDLLPADHPKRGRVGLWWGLYLAGGFLVFIPAVVAATSSVVTGTLAALIPIGVDLWALTIIHDLVLAIRDSQDEAAQVLREGAVSPG